MSTPDFPDAAEIERRKALSPEARRALEEADARRIETAEDVADLPEDERGEFQATLPGQETTPQTTELDPRSDPEWGQSDEDEEEETSASSAT